VVRGTLDYITFPLYTQMLNKQLAHKNKLLLSTSHNLIHSIVIVFLKDFFPDYHISAH